MSHIHSLEHHHHDISEKSVKYLTISFVINMLLSIAEFIGGIIAGSVSLIGDALHNTSDALSILIAIIAFRIGRHKASARYTYGFKRAEIIGGFVNLILLFISGCYLLIEAIERLLFPKPIAGMTIIVISVFALIIDAVTAKISHHGSEHNTNMKMLFIHNLADAFGSLGVIFSGLCILFFNIYRIDGVIAILISAYMIAQSVFSFPKIVNILMNAAPDDFNTERLIDSLKKLPGVKDVHHVHVWCINEHDVSLECHLVTENIDLLPKVQDLLCREFDIHHSNIQIETSLKCPECEL